MDSLSSFLHMPIGPSLSAMALFCKIVSLLV